ncbi:MAG: hypothetical protein H6766_02155 [Candidatus Peribacteria bacterium]|nr:MAG: hypothetical protein H6766_02155 [Candidatus Peribacteria bacterium]
MPPGEGVLKIPQLLQHFEENNYTGYYSLKIDINKKDLADVDKVELILSKSLSYIKEQFTKINIQEE